MSISNWKMKLKENKFKYNRFNKNWSSHSTTTNIISSRLVHFTIPRAFPSPANKKKKKNPCDSRFVGSSRTKSISFLSSRSAAETCPLPLPRSPIIHLQNLHSDLHPLLFITPRLLCPPGRRFFRALPAANFFPLTLVFYYLSWLIRFFSSPRFYTMYIFRLLSDARASLNFSDLTSRRRCCEAREKVRAKVWVCTSFALMWIRLCGVNNERCEGLRMFRYSRVSGMFDKLGREWILATKSWFLLYGTVVIKWIDEVFFAYFLSILENMSRQK